MKKKKTKLEDTSQNMWRLTREIKDLARKIINNKRAYDKKVNKLYEMVGSLLDEKELKENLVDEEIRECLSLAEILKSKLQSCLKK